MKDTGSSGSDKAILTELDLRKAFVSELQTYLGAYEADPRHLELLKWYNRNESLPRGYPMKVQDAWCAATPSAISVKLHMTGYIFPECSCPKMIRLYQQHGRWVETDDFCPQIGDLVMYDWSDDGIGDDKRSPDHVGTVICVKHGQMEILEGNMGHRVGIRTLPLNGRYIRGFCCPDYQAMAREGRVFADISPADWSLTAAEWAARLGIAAGVSETRFDPERPASRGEVMTMLWRMRGSPEPNGEERPFIDVAPAAYYAKAARWALEKGITSGTSGRRFGPEEHCTRGQAITFLWRTAGSPEQKQDPAFSDLSSGDYFYQACLWAARNQITAGVGGGEFSPEDICTRGQIVTFLFRCSQVQGCFPA